MSHRLPYHEGNCKNIHGHTYKIRVELEGEPDENGMVVDYYYIEQVVAPLIRRLDHSFVCDAGDRLMIDFLQKAGFKYNIIENYTTAENLAIYAVQEIAPGFRNLKNLSRLKIRIYETDDVYAEIGMDL